MDMASVPSVADVTAEADAALLHEAILERVIRFSGATSFDFKELVTQTRLVRAAGRALWRIVRPFRPEVLVGPGFGGAPLLFATALAAAQENDADLAIWMVRDQRKTYYGKRWVEGPRLAGRPRAVVLDDFLGHGSAIELIDQALAAEALTAQLCAIAVLYDAWSPRGSRQLSVSRCPVVSVFKRHDFGLTRDCHDARPPLMEGAAPALVEKPLWWRFELNEGTAYPLKSSPVIAQDAVFVADDRSRVSCLDGLTGELRWRTESVEQPAKGIVQRLQYADGSLVYGCYDGTVTRLRADDGGVLWRMRVGTAVHSTPAVDGPGRRVFVNVETFTKAGPGGYLGALDWDTGATLWRHPHAFWPPGTPAHDPASGAVVATCNDGALVCVDGRTGALRWTATTDGLVRGRPAISGGRVFLITESGWLQAFDLSSGAALSKRQVGASSVLQFTLVDRGAVVAMNGEGQVAAFDVEDFRLRWIGTLRSEGVSAAIPAGAYLHVLSRTGHLAAIERASGLKVWEGRVDGRYSNAPAVGVVAGQAMLVCASNDAGLLAFRIHPHYDEHRQT